MEFRAREVKKPLHPLDPKHPNYKENLERSKEAQQGNTTKFRKRESSHMKHIKSRTSFAPDFGGVEQRIQAELDKSKNNPSINMPPPAKYQLQKGQKVFSVSFNCEMFEIGEFNQLDILCSEDSIDRQYKMETGMRTYVYPIDNDKKGNIKELMDYWKPKLVGRKIKFSVANRIDNSEISGDS